MTDMIYALNKRNAPVTYECANEIMKRTSDTVRCFKRSSAIIQKKKRVIELHCLKTEVNSRI